METSKIQDLKSNLYNRKMKKMFILNTIKDNPELDLRQILAKLHDYMGKRTAKEWFEAMELNGEIEIKEEPKGKYIIRVKK